MTIQARQARSLLDVRTLRTSFVVDGVAAPVVDGVSLRIPNGRTVSLVGESGCGKSVTALSIMRLIPQPPGKIAGGKILFAQSGDDEPIDLLQLTEEQMRRIRGNRIAMIFQDPLTSLNPVYTAGEQIVEAIELHQPLRGKAAWDQAVDALRRVGVAAPEHRACDYPHQLSGGMQQRVMIAMALSCRPSLLIADEPTTALDVTIQLQILELLKGLQAETGMSLLMITHDLGVVAEIADYVYVMYAGRIVEHGPVDELLADPLHPYTQGLLRCMPRLSQRKERLEVIPGRVPDPADWPSGCRFHPRCRLSAERACRGGRAVASIHSVIGDAVLRRCIETYSDEPSGEPDLREFHPSHHVACWETHSPSLSVGAGGGL